MPITPEDLPPAPKSSWIAKHRVLTVTIAVVLVLALVVGGVLLSRGSDSSSDSANESASEASSSEAVPTDSSTTLSEASSTASEGAPSDTVTEWPPGPMGAPGVNQPAPAPAEVADPVMHIVDIRENSMSSRMDSPLQWLDELVPLSTPEYHAALEAEGYRQGSIGQIWTSSRYQVINVALTNVQCELVPQVRNTSVHATVRCLYNTKVVDASGNELTAYPPGWGPYTEKKSVSYEMVKQNGTWLLDTDWTGRAS